MMEKWNGVTKWETAKKLLKQTLDSIQKADPSIEVGLRVFGHQSPKAMHDCKDSKLEVPITKKSAPLIHEVLDEIKPQGYTPIAFSLFLATGDFINTTGVNSIILITDGIENCEGDPCAAGDALRSRNINLKPFIIGLGLNESDKNNFDCVGNYYDAMDESSFKNAMNVVISQATNSTTLQVNLIDAFGKPSETNVELTFYDAYSGVERYNYVHTLNINNEPDTLRIDAVERYHILAHTTPEIWKRDVQLIAGKHNIIGIEIPQGTLSLKETGNLGFSNVQAVIMNSQTGEIINSQNFNSEKKYIAGSYDIEVLSLPRISYEDFNIVPAIENTIIVDQPGLLSMTTKDNMIFSIFVKRNDKLEKIYESKITNDFAEVELLPGDYTVVYRSNTKKRTENTREAHITIKSNKTFALKL